MHSCLGLMTACGPGDRTWPLLTVSRHREENMRPSGALPHAAAERRGGRPPASAAASACCPSPGSPLGSLCCPLAPPQAGAGTTAAGGRSAELASAAAPPADPVKRGDGSLMPEYAQSLGISVCLPAGCCSFAAEH